MHQARVKNNRISALCGRNRVAGSRAAVGVVQDREHAQDGTILQYQELRQKRLWGRDTRRLLVPRAALAKCGAAKGTKIASWKNPPHGPRVKKGGTDPGAADQPPGSCRTDEEPAWWQGLPNNSHQRQKSGPACAGVEGVLGRTTPSPYRGYAGSQIPAYWLPLLSNPCKRDRISLSRSNARM